MRNYPIYRKYTGLDVWFKITSDVSFIEIKKIGTRLLMTKVEAIQFPEKNFIQDMISLNENRWQEVDKKEVEKLLNSEEFI